jgi:hypothetical protein
VEIREKRKKLPSPKSSARTFWQKAAGFRQTRDLAPAGEKKSDVQPCGWQSTEGKKEGQNSWPRRETQAETRLFTLNRASPPGEKALALPHPIPFRFSMLTRNNLTRIGLFDSVSGYSG